MITRIQDRIHEGYIEFPNCYPVIYGGSDKSIHIRNKEGEEIITYPAKQVKKIEYIP
jgi:hypothetical protein